MSTKVWVLESTETLVCDDEWNDSVLSTTFAKMLDLARDRVKYYKSDLYRDAIWLKENVTGPMSFEWIPRESGTFLGTDLSSYIKLGDWPDAVKYRFDIWKDDYRWKLSVYEEKDSLRTEDDPDGTYTEDDQGNWHPVNTIVNEVFGRSEPVGPWMGTQESNFPTLRNETTRKENKMDNILNDLRDKLDEANGTRDQLEEYKDNINQGIDDLDSYIGELEDLISSLDSMPEVSVYVDLDTVSFDS